uniref:NADH dehydrogenase [ubiquinone] 1 beta subcomplex subunit 8, mitochondrial n=1 Tax=Panagrolaimus sp. JU765 TaxID=591449 RepID=A0AC34R612_9BILA
MANVLKVSTRSIHATPIVARGPLSFDGWYPRDHKPGPYPTNDKERRAAAIKYGLRPEDYHRIDRNNVKNYAGDYPELGTITFDHKDPYENYSDRHHRRNWGEQVGMQMMRYRADRYTFTGLEEEQYTKWKAFVLIARVVVPMLIISWWYSNPAPEGGVRWKSPVLAKQYPYDFYRAFPFDDPRKYPITNYTFEPAD